MSSREVLISACPVAFQPARSLLRGFKSLSISASIVFKSVLQRRLDHGVDFLSGDKEHRHRLALPHAGRLKTQQLVEPTVLQLLRAGLHRFAQFGALDQVLVDLLGRRSFDLTEPLVQFVQALHRGDPNAFAPPRLWRPGP